MASSIFTTSLAMTPLDKRLATISPSDKDACELLMSEFPVSIGQSPRDMMMTRSYKNYGFYFARRYTDAEKEYHTNGKEKDFSSLTVLKPGCEVMINNESVIVDVACDVENGLDIHFKLMLHEQSKVYVMLYTDCQRQVIHIRRFWKKEEGQKGPNPGMPVTKMGVGLTFKYSEIIRCIQVMKYCYQFLDDYVSNYE